MLYAFLSLLLSFLAEKSQCFSNLSSFARQQHTILKGRARRVQEEYDYENDDDAYYSSDRTRFREPRRIDDIYEDYSSYYEDNNYRSNAAPVPLQPRRRTVSRNFADVEKSMYDDSRDSAFNSYDEDDDDDDDYYEEDMSTAGGNYWSNPQGQQDADVVAKRRRQQRPPSPPRPSSATAPPHRRRDGRTRRTTFRSGTPPPPEPVEDFYNKLFWFGFDPSADPDADSSDKKTMFGGTKGKFNGLSYINEGVGVLPREVRGRRRPRNAEEPEDSFSEDDELEYDDDTEPPYNRYKGRNENDRYNGYREPLGSNPRARSYPENDYERPRRRRQGSGDWVTNEVSGWFEDDDDNWNNNREEQVTRSKKPPRKRSKSTSMWSPFNALDSFFGPGNLDDKAYEYDRRMGIGSRRSSNPPSRRSKPRRKGYAYPYDEEEDYDVVAPRDDQDDVIDADLVIVEEVEEANVGKDHKSVDSEASVEMSWEERALAMERVPPPDVMAWGPTGEEGVDARTKAILDAMEDINTARQNVEERRKKIELCKEDLVILRVDSELEGKRLRASRLDPRIVQDKLRRMQLKLDDASRALRLAQARFESAKELLRELESRHWAVLSFYDPTRAESAIQDALRELGESEPAVRRFMEKNGRSTASSSVQTEPIERDARGSKSREETGSSF